MALVAAGVFTTAAATALAATPLDAAFATNDAYAFASASQSRWAETARRMDAQPVVPASACRGLSQPEACGLARWTITLNLARSLDARRQLDFVQQAVNALPYRADRENWGRADYWETPAEMLARGGDCEGFALTKYFALRTLGVADADMRIVVVWDAQDREEHAILLVRMGGETWLLDNKMARPERIADHEGRYRLIYYVNESGGLRLPALQTAERAESPRMRLADGGRTLVLVVNPRTRADRDAVRIQNTMPAGR